MAKVHITKWGRESAERLAMKFAKRKKSNPISPNQADLVNWNLYDRLTTAANTATATSYTFFNTPIGGTKTKADTNLILVQQLPAPQWFNAQRLGFYFSSDMIKSDIDSTLKNYYFELWVGQKIYAEGPLITAPSGYGIFGATTRNNEGGWVNGSPIGSVIGFDLVLPNGIGDGLSGVSILQSQNFYVNVIGASFVTAVATAPTNGVGLNFMCFLGGQLSRGVQ